MLLLFLPRTPTCSEWYVPLRQERHLEVSLNESCQTMSAFDTLTKHSAVRLSNHFVPL